MNKNIYLPSIVEQNIPVLTLNVPVTLKVKPISKKKWGGRKRDAVPSKVFKLLIEQTNINSFQGKRNRLVYYILWITGCRINELLWFRENNWKDIIGTGRTEIYEPKLKQSKTLVISERKRKMFQSWKWALLYFSEFPESPLLRSQKGKPLNNIYVISYFNHILKEKGLQEGLLLRTHSFRVGLVTDLLQKVESNVAQDIIGHKNLTTTLKYNRGTTSIRKKKDAINSIR